MGLFEKPYSKEKQAELDKAGKDTAAWKELGKGQEEATEMNEKMKDAAWDAKIAAAAGDPRRISNLWGDRLAEAKKQLRNMESGTLPDEFKPEGYKGPDYERYQRYSPESLNKDRDAKRKEIEWIEKQNLKAYKAVLEAEEKK